MSVKSDDQSHREKKEDSGIFDLNQPDSIAGGTEKLKFPGAFLAVNCYEEQRAHACHREQGVYQQIGDTDAVVKHEPSEAQQGSAAEELPASCGGGGRIEAG